MRILYTLFLLLPAISFAQPVILQEHLPQPGQILVAYNDYQGGPQFLPTPPGPTAQVWDYSNAFGNISMEQITFHPATDVPGHEYFPEATTALSYSFATTDLAVFYSAGTEGFKVEGFYSTTPEETTITTHVNDVHIPTPLTYGNSTTVDHLEIEIIIPASGQPAYLRRIWTNRTMTADAFGTLITPEWPDGVEVIRHRYDTHTVIDSSFIDMSGTGNGPWEFEAVLTHEEDDITYNFLRAGQPSFVMEMSGDASFVVYYGSNIITGVAGEASARDQAQAYPNPANDRITIIPGINGAHIVEMFDINGRSMATLALQGNDRITIPTDAWPAGAYTYRCLDAQGVPLNKGRFVVVH